MRFVGDASATKNRMCIGSPIYVGDLSATPPAVGDQFTSSDNNIRTCELIADAPSVTRLPSFRIGGGGGASVGASLRQLSFFCFIFSPKNLEGGLKFPPEPPTPLPN